MSIPHCYLFGGFVKEMVDKPHGAGDAAIVITYAVPTPGTVEPLPNRLFFTTDSENESSTFSHWQTDEFGKLQVLDENCAPTTSVHDNKQKIDAYNPPENSVVWSWGTDSKKQ